ncbi:MAG TPA: HAD-IIIA family hydrolase [Thermosulfidibacter takaii]|uniref:HAD-IIIA family hydrolase n=1 Tax=Thermosulfidibacter takaii TaxID=412593 RepID=A0A7C0U6E7_9BACT|nr:HAD-IIIA family hydrolase [Thermosulfidibacter takaii]
MEEKLKKIILVVMDVDGVLTDGRIILGSDGQEFKCFNVKDGHGILLLHRAGIKTALITGRQSEAVEKRARELKIPLVFQNSKNKLETYQKLKAATHAQDHQIAYIGDDLVDIPIMKRAGVAVAVADAHPQVKEVAHLVTEAPGGKGAVREFIELLLKAQDKWEEATQRYWQ